MNIQALHFVLDIDGNGSISSWEVIDALKWGVTLPGRLLVEGLGNIPLVANTFGIQASAATGYASFNSLLATGVSLVFWVLVLYLLTRIGAQREPKASTQAAPPVIPGMPHYRGPKPHKHSG
ncbi:hypothetical protein [Castellaniella caeni]|uniref:hypothetical protein n=1 Tax=Castellaniella caeni TaxID=266123 RepID=UPI000C9EC8A2|nr:hypothetical protein [Castellaniella caeni]